MKKLLFVLVLLGLGFTSIALARTPSYPIPPWTIFSYTPTYYDLDEFAVFQSYTPKPNDVVKISLNGVEMYFTGITKVDSDEIRMSTLVWSNGSIPNLHLVGGEIRTIDFPSLF